MSMKIGKKILAGALAVMSAFTMVSAEPIHSKEMTTVSANVKKEDSKNGLFKRIFAAGSMALATVLGVLGLTKFFSRDSKETENHDEIDAPAKLEEKEEEEDEAQSDSEEGKEEKKEEEKKEEEKKEEEKKEEEREEESSGKSGNEAQSDGEEKERESDEGINEEQYIPEEYSGYIDGWYNVLYCYSIPEVKRIIRDFPGEGRLKQAYVDLFDALDGNLFCGREIKSRLEHIGKVNLYKGEHSDRRYGSISCLDDDIKLRDLIRSAYLDVNSRSSCSRFFGDGRICNNILCRLIIFSNDLKKPLSFCKEFEFRFKEKYGVFGLKAIIDYDNSKGYPIVSLYMRCEDREWHKYSLDFDRWEIKHFGSDEYNHEELKAYSHLTKLVYTRIKA